MSSAFVKESEGQWLHDIPPTMPALINYLTTENNGVRVYENKTWTDKATGKTVHGMSNGLAYMVDENNRWMIVW
jgi:hypothetical protein